MAHLSLRHQALKGIGLRQWFSKYTLPSAAETPDAFFSTIQVIENNPIAEEAKSKNLSQSVPEMLVAVRSTVKSVPGFESRLESDAELKEKSTVISKAVLGKLAPNLTLSALSSNQIVVLFEQADSSDKDLERSLLEAIISVIADKKNSELNQSASVLAWPIFESSVFIAELSSFFDVAVRRWLEGQRWSECNYVIYFGEHLSSLESILLDVRSAQNSEYKVVSCKASLAQILGSPIKKKNLWALFSRVGMVSG